MFRWLRRHGFSGEQRGESTGHVSKHADDHELGKTPSRQNEQDELAYADALRKQRDQHIGADGLPVRLRVVDRETGQIGEPFIRKGEESGHNPGPPPLPPTSAA